MKTTIAVPLLLLAACAGGPAPQDDAALLVGLAVRDITPPFGYGMSGYYHERGADGVRDPIQAKAIAFRQGGISIVMAVADLCFITTDLGDEVRRRASERTGVPVSAIAVSATHSHTGPDYGRDFRRWIEAGRPASGYPPALAAGIVDAIVLAVQDLRPRRLDFARGTQDPVVSFNRRFHMKDGTIRTWASYFDGNTVREAGPIDPEIGILLARDPATGKDAGALVNFALHLDTLGGTKWSADFPHDLGESLKEELGPRFLTIFANGCCGDINHANPRDKVRNKTDVIGRAIGASVKRALPGRSTLKAPRLAAASVKVPLPLQRFTSDELAWAKDLVGQDEKGAKIPFLEEVKARKMLHADALRKRGDALRVEVQAFRLDADTAIVTLPGEVFVDLGLAIKKGSPFKRTFVVELSNASETKYIPTLEQCPKGGYEVTNSTIEPGGGELLVEAALGLLRGLE
jgi:hypothetical protein